MSHLEYKMLFQQMPDYKLLQHYEHFKLPNFKCYKARSISLCMQKITPIFIYGHTDYFSN
jgi:hypothetical protein